MAKPIEHSFPRGHPLPDPGTPTPGCGEPPCSPHKALGLNCLGEIQGEGCGFLPLTDLVKTQFAWPCLWSSGLRRSRWGLRRCILTSFQVAVLLVWGPHWYVGPWRLPDRMVAGAASQWALKGWGSPGLRWHTVRGTQSQIKVRIKESNWGSVQAFLCYFPSCLGF